MSKVKNKNTTPELIVRKFLFSKGFRYRINVKNLPGKPDIVLPKYRTIIFVNGCFWHGHTCRYAKLPVTNVKFWETKIGSNVKRDHEILNKLHSLGWSTIVVWECELKANHQMLTLEDLVKKIHHAGNKET